MLQEIFYRYALNTPLKKNKGFLLVEILIASVLFSIISLVLFKTLDTSIVSSNVTLSIMTDQDLKTVIAKSLSPGHCEKNLASIPADGIVQKLTYYDDPTSDPDGSVLLSLDDTTTLDENEGIFRDFLDIVSMRISDVSGSNTQKEFTVYFKRRKVRHFNTKKGGVCTSEDISGCYEHKCTLNYKKDPHDVVSTCELLNCFSLVKTSKPDDDELKGIKLAQTCDRHWGWDVGNNKCVYTGRCVETGVAHPDDVYYGFDPNYNNFIKYLIFLQDNYYYTKSGPHTVGNSFKADKECNNSPCCPTHSGTHKKCLNDSNGECDIN